MSQDIRIPLVKVLMPPREILMPQLESVLYGGMIAEGEHVYKFESEFERTFGIKNSIATSSGTGALHIGLLLAGVKPGDEVITTSMTAEPTNTSILQVGAHPIFADVDPLNGNIDPESAAKLISEKTKAIVVVHYAGYPVKIDQFRALADEFGLSLIEDCAHALGAKYGNRPIGSVGDFSIFSFQAIKHMTTIDGGMLIVKDNSRIDEAKRLRWFGLSKGVARTEVDIKIPGYKYNMNNVQGIIGQIQILEIEKKIGAHVQNGQFFDHELKKINGLEPAQFERGDLPSYWLYTLLSDEVDNVIKRLASVGVAASKLHRPNHLHTVFEPYRRPLPNLDAFYRRLVHIPCGWWLDPQDRELILHALSEG
jgi:perosamine synthetase